MAKYPGAIPTLNEIFKAIDYVSWTNASEWDDLRAELRAALVELGTDPAGTFATVKARLDNLLPHFHDRGDPAAYDFTYAQFTLDGAAHDLNLSSIVPAGAKAVSLRVFFLDDSVAKHIQFRKNGNSNWVIAPNLRTQVGGVWVEAFIVVACDTNRIIEYKGTESTNTGLYMSICGWWK